MTKAKIQIKQTEETCHALAVYLAENAGQYMSKIVIVSDGQEHDAKSILNMMALSLNQERVIEVKAEGPDEEAAVENIVRLLKS